MKKTIAALTNTQGGHLIFGIDDKTREITGVDEASLFQQMIVQWLKGHSRMTGTGSPWGFQARVLERHRAQEYADVQEKR